jgi:hypothetical protein
VAESHIVEYARVGVEAERKSKHAIRRKNKDAYKGFKKPSGGFPAATSLSLMRPITLAKVGLGEI